MGNKKWPNKMDKQRKLSGLIEYDRGSAAYVSAGGGAGQGLHGDIRDEGKLKTHGARRNDCGMLCYHKATGCLLGNKIPEWNLYELVYEGHWQAALLRGQTMGITTYIVELFA